MALPHQSCSGNGHTVHTPAWIEGSDFLRAFYSELLYDVLGRCEKGPWRRYDLSRTIALSNEGSFLDRQGQLLCALRFVFYGRFVNQESRLDYQSLVHRIPKRFC